MPRGAVFVHEGAVPEVKPGRRECKGGKEGKAGRKRNEGNEWKGKTSDGNEAEAEAFCGGLRRSAMLPLGSFQCLSQSLSR